MAQAKENKRTSKDHTKSNKMIRLCAAKNTTQEVQVALKMLMKD
jgi:hypothetical protein